MHTPSTFDPPSVAAIPSVVPSRLVTDAPTRVFHWLFALSFVGAYLTADGERWRLLHVSLGYTMAGLLGFRVLYGLLGPRTAGMGLLWRKLTGASAWLRSLPQANSLQDIPWRPGQNVLTALSILALLVMVVPLTLSGYATYHDWGDFLGGDWVEDVHEFFGEAVLVVALAHVAWIAILSVLRRKNQALPMLSGRIPGPGPNLVQKNRTWLAAMLLLAVLTFGAWEWQQSPSGLLPGNTQSSRHHDRD